MTVVKFFRENNRITGFTSAGHSGHGRAGKDIVCAAVSSAIYMTANTITEILKTEADIRVSEAEFHLSLKEDSSGASDILAGLELHLTELSKEYPKFLQILN